VFFYQSSDGGRVFFDDLGPPWPKHPCTDNRSIPRKIAPSAFLGKRTDIARSYKWQLDGWKPFFISSVSRVDKTILQMNGNSENKSLSVFFCKEINSSDVSPPITNESIAYLRKENEETYEISLTISVPPRHMTARAFTSLLATRSAADATQEGGAASVAERARARYHRDRAAQEDLLLLVARHEIGDPEAPPFPANLAPRLEAAVASRGGIVEWAKSHPSYAEMKARAQSRRRRAAKIKRRVKIDRRKVAATKWKTKGRGR
jgi:hypothetical protein